MGTVSMGNLPSRQFKVVGACMHDAIMSSGRDTLLVAIPLLVLLMMGVLRLDELIFASPKGAMRRHRAMCGVDEDGRPILTDPDGREWKKTPARR